MATEGSRPPPTPSTSPPARRFSGGAGDPNYLAAGLVAAIALAAGLLPSVRDPIAKVGVGAAIAALALALAATGSRGGLIGAAAALVAAVCLARGQRTQAAALGVCVVAAAGAFFLASPSALERVTSFDAGGNGRAELWLVAWRMSEDRPLAGFGIANFPFESHNYVREPGNLNFVRLIVDEPHVAHNVYLQQLAETGIVGLGLLLFVIVVCLTAASTRRAPLRRAGRRRTGHPRSRLGSRHGRLPRCLDLHLGQHGQATLDRPRARAGASGPRAPSGRA